MEAVFLHIADVAITAGLVVLAVILIRLLCRKAPKWITMLLWGIVGLRLLLPFSIEWDWSVMPSLTVTDYEMTTLYEKPDTQTFEAETGDAETVTAKDPVPLPDGGTDVTVPISPQIQTHPTVSVVQAASAVWIFGVAAMLWYAVMSYTGVWRRVRTATKDERGIYRSEAVGSPFILGVFRPRIYVPYNMEGEQLKAVLAHERAHIKRLDHIIKPLGFLLLSVYWFQPLLWVAYVLLCRDIELACDERVVKTLGEDERRRYSMALVTSAVGRRRIAACPLAFGEVAVKERVKTVMNYKKPAFWIVIAAVVLSIVAAVCLLTDPPACKEQPYGSFAGADLEFYQGDYRYKTLYLDDDSEELTTSMTIGDSGAFGFAVKEIDEKDMTVTVQCNRELWIDGECVKSFTVSYDEDVTLHLSDKEDETSWTIRVSLALRSEKEEREWYRDDESQTMTMYRYVSGNTALYLYNGYFSLVENDTGITSLSEPLANYRFSSGWQAISLSLTKYFPTASITEGRYEWVEDTLVLTEDGDLSRYVFKVEKDRATLKNIKGEMRRHKTSDAPILENRRTFSCEYKVTADKISDIPRPIAYTISDVSGKHCFSGESSVNDLRIASVGNGQVMITREDPDEDGYCEEHEWIDLAKGESLGIRGSAVSNHAALGNVGYVPTITQADGKVFVTAVYVSWCGTGNPSPIAYELEGLSSLRNDTVKAVIDGDEIVISYTDDNGNAHVIAQELTDGGVPITRPLVAVSEYDAEGKTVYSGEAAFRSQEGVLRYNQISEAYVQIDGEYVDVAQALVNGTLTFEQLEECLQKAVDEGTAKKTVLNDAGEYRVDILNADAYHTIFVNRNANGVYEVRIGYKTYVLPVIG